MPPTDLRTDFLANPLGISPDDLIFAWHADGPQKAYQVAVHLGDLPLWGSGRVEGMTPRRPAGLWWGRWRRASG